MEFYSIGIYHLTEKEFFGKLEMNRIDTFCDIRRRRGLRGKVYSFGNSQRLQERLAKMKINYLHIPELAPTLEMIQQQDRTDNNSGISRRDRNHLSPSFIKAFENEILASFDMKEFVSELKEKGGERVALFCVEEQAKACHRSLVTTRLRRMGYVAVHL